MENNLIYFNFLGEAIPIGLIVYQPGKKIFYINKKAYRLLDISAEEANISSENNLEALFPEIYCNEYLYLPNKVIRREIKSFNLNNNNFELVYLYDVTAEVDLKDKLFLYETVLNNTPNIAYNIFDKDGNALFYDDLSSKYDCMPKENAIGKHLSNIVTYIDDDPLLKTLKTGKAFCDHKVHYTTQQGEEVIAIGTTFPIYKDNVLIGVCGYCRFKDTFSSLISGIIELQSLSETRNKYNYNGTRYRFNDIIGKCPDMVAAIEKGKRAALHSSPILLYGETGTGKELFAQSIHNAGYNAQEPFVAVNCSAIPEALLESTLFGTKKGSFTGSENSVGLFEAAKKGTVLLDEINSMPLRLQPKLLRVIEEKKVRRIGDSREIPIHCRIISTCNKPPRTCIQEETLRLDLYYRISAITIDIPPLRDRGDDIFLFCNHFIKSFSSISSWSSQKLSKEVRKLFMRYSWPGNVRELQHVMENVVVFSDDSDSEIQLKHLPSYLLEEEEKLPGDFVNINATAPLKRQLAEFERKAIIKALRENKYNLTKAADQIGYTRSNLQYRIKILDIN